MIQPNISIDSARLRPGDPCLIRIGHCVYEGKVHAINPVAEYVGDDGFTRHEELSSVRVVPRTYAGMNAMVIQLVALEQLVHDELGRVREMRDAAADREGL